MKKASFSLLIAAFCLGLTACKSNLPKPSDEDAARVSSIYPELTVADLKEGRSLYKDNCDLCHGLKDPRDFSRARLEEVVPNMVKGVNKKKEEKLSPEQAELILQYLVTMSAE